MGSIIVEPKKGRGEKTVLLEIDRNKIDINKENNFAVLTVRSTTDGSYDKLLLTVTETGNGVNLANLTIQEEKITITPASASIPIEILNSNIINSRYEIGIIYSTTNKYPDDKDGTKEKANVVGGSSFLSELKLKPNTQYWAIAYAYNESKTPKYYWGNKTITFETKSTPPSVSISKVDATSTTAIFYAEITNIGIPEYTERGFVFHTSQIPSKENSLELLPAEKTKDINFSKQTTKIDLNKEYWVRAYVTNNDTIIYSLPVSFKAKLSEPKLSVTTVANKNISAGTAIFKSSIENVGDPEYTERGFVYGKTHNPTTDDTKIISPGSGAGIFSVNATKLDAGSVYYVRAYASNIKETAYGEEVELDFNIIKPQFSSVTITNISPNSVTFNASISNIGDPSYTERGFVYSTLPNPTIENGIKKIIGGSGSGTYSAPISDLNPATQYYVRAYATNIEINYIVYSGTNFSTKFNLSGSLKNSLKNTAIPNATIVFKQSTSTTAQTTTNDRGEFLIPNFSFGNYTVSIVAEGYQTKSELVSIHSTSIDLTAVPLAIVTGTVADDDGILMKNTEVRLSSNSYQNRVDVTVNTNEKGEYVFENIPPQEYNISASATNYENAYKDLTIKPGDNSVNLTMQIINGSYISVSGSYQRPSHFDLYFTAESGMEGTSTTTTIQVKNARQKKVQWSLVNVPTYGIKFNISKGDILPGETQSIILTLTYPKKGLAGCLRFNSANTYCGSTHPYTYLWNWKESYYAGCSQDIMVDLGKDQVILNVDLRQNTCWAN